MKEIYKNLIYLLSCSINNVSPNKKRVETINLDHLYIVSKKHSVIAIVNLALEMVNIKDKRFNEAYNKSIRKNVLLDIERNSILEDFDKNEIWYMPLKGSILKDLYPSDGMRQMSDNDIFIDKKKQQQTKEIMKSHGYSVEHYGVGNHDVYFKEPVLNFELHTKLFDSSNHEVFYNYYKNIRNIMIKDDNNNFGYHLSDENFYVYITAHEWKHYNGGGTGIRSLLDCYIYLKNKNNSLDWKYIKEEISKLEISDFEEDRRKLALKIFSNEKFPKLNDKENEMLTYYLTSGTYGTYENIIKKKLQNQSKLSFWFHSIFIPRKQMNASVPFTSISPLLYPIGVIWRCFRVVIFKRDKIKRTIKEVKNYDK